MVRVTLVPAQTANPPVETPPTLAVPDWIVKGLEVDALEPQPFFATTEIVPPVEFAVTTIVAESAPDTIDQPEGSVQL